MEIFFKFILGSSMAGVLFFSEPVFEKNPGHLVISAALNGIFTNKVERIINTGTGVIVIYYVSVYASTDSGTVLMKKRIINGIRYDFLEGSYILNLNGTVHKTIDRGEAYRKTGYMSAEFDYSPEKVKGFSDCYIDASIEYGSSLKMNLPGTVLWDYYVPYKKVSGRIDL